MTRSSRFVRPISPRPMVLQPRDRAVLRVLHDYRFLTSVHLHALVFGNVSLRMANRRLRMLWENKLVERHFMPFVLDGVHPPPKLASRPIYGLAKEGAALVADDRGLELEHVQPGPVPWTTIEHNLAAADFVVGVMTAAQMDPDVHVPQVQPEPVLWRTLTPWRAESRPASFIVPDAAVTLALPRTGVRQSFCLEVVRAGVRSGNKTLLAKMRKYVELHHRHFFRDRYGHDPLRAVLIATTSEERVRRFRELAATLPHGRRLFWFGCYETTDERGRRVSDFSTDTVFSPMWTDTDGNTHSLIPSEATSQNAAASLA